MWLNKQNTKQTTSQSAGTRAVGLMAIVSAALSVYLIGGAIPSLGRTQPTLKLANESSPREQSLDASAKQEQFPTKKIQNIRVGDRVMAYNPELTDEERRLLDELEPEPNSTTWRRLKLTMIKPDGHRLDIELLRPLVWLDAVGVKTEHDATATRTVATQQTIHLDLPELGAQGPAGVSSVGPCPEISPGSGRVVTGTFAHEVADTVLDLYVEGLDEPIGVTADHPFWSEEQQQFIQAERLKVGEHLRTATGSCPRITALVPRVGFATVYNLEVNAQHVYFVSNSGILVHNTYVVPQELVELYQRARRIREFMDQMPKGSEWWWKAFENLQRVLKEIKDFPRG